MFTFFTELIKKDVVDRRGHWLGHPYDFTAKLDEAYPRVTALVVSSGAIRKHYYIIPWKDVHQTPDGFQLKTPLETVERRDSFFVHLLPPVPDNENVARNGFPGEPPLYIPMPPH